MRQVRIRTTCDPCQAWHGAENEEGVQTVQVAGGQTLDLCPSHRDDLAPFLALVAEWGATPERNGGTRKRQGTRAAASGAPGAPSAASGAPGAPPAATQAPNRRGGKRARARRANNPDAARYPCPLCQAEVVNVSAHLATKHSTTLGAVYGTTCPLCGHDGAGGTHLSGHGVTGGMPGAFQLAQAQGDPHGVIAARAAALAQ